MDIGSCFTMRKTQNLRDSNKPQIKRQHNVFPICLPYRQSHATKQSTARQCYKKNIYEGTFSRKKSCKKV